MISVTRRQSCTLSTSVRTSWRTALGHQHLKLLELICREDGLQPGQRIGLHLLMRGLHLFEGGPRSRRFGLLVRGLHLGVLVLEYGLNLGFLVCAEVEKRGQMIHVLRCTFVRTTVPCPSGWGIGRLRERYAGPQGGDRKETEFHGCSETLVKAAAAT